MFQIGQISFNKISGPVSFHYLEPTEDFLFSLSKKIYCPPIILIGDNHFTREKICYDNEEFTLSIFTPLWLRCLDSLGVENYPIYYGVESFLPTKITNLEYYFTHENKNWLYNIDNQTVMGYIPKQYPECFSKNKNVLKKCITENINFLFTDFRLGLSFTGISPIHKKKIKKKTFEKLQQNYFQENITNKRSHERKQSVFKNSTEEYENYVYNCLESCLGVNRAESISEGKNKINGYSPIEIIDLAFTDVKKCADIIFDFNNVQVQRGCQLFKMIKLKSLDKNRIKNIFTEYFIQIINTIPLKWKICFYNICSRFKKETNFFHYILDLSQKTTKVDREYIEKFKKLEDKMLTTYNECQQELASTLLIPFNDIYFLVSTFGTKTPLAIYHSGNFHSTELLKLLIKNGAYNCKYSFGDNNSQCINITKNFNLDKELINYLNNYGKEIFSSFYEKQELIQHRVENLGDDLYKEILNGKVITEEELVQIFKDNTNLIETLQFEKQTIYFNKEYSNKKLSLN